MMSYTLRIPELGEDVETVDVIAVLVTVGNALESGQTVIEVETEKASVEVPTDTAGTVLALHVKAGDSLSAGDPILTLDPASTAASKAAVPETEETPEQPETTAEAETEVQAADVVEAVAAKPSDHLAPTWTPPPGPPRLVPASPTVRRFAREVGVDINEVKGTGTGGRLSIDDVKTFARERLEGRTDGAVVPVRPLPDFSRFGPVEEEPATKIRRVTAERLARAWATVPQVTHHDLADITRLEKARKRYRDRTQGSAPPLTLTAILVKVMAGALKVFPNVNSSIDVARNVIIRKRFIHIGVAVDTAHGLLVPVIRNADQKNVNEIAAELDELAKKARDRKLQPSEMEGGNFSVSNLGGIGGTAFSPIVNWPEVAILGVSRGSMQPIWDGAAFQPRLMLPLSLSYDHRLVDGAEAARFLRWTAEALEEPLLLALEG